VAERRFAMPGFLVGRRLLTSRLYPEIQNKVRRLFRISEFADPAMLPFWADFRHGS